MFHAEFKKRIKQGTRRYEISVGAFLRPGIPVSIQQLITIGPLIAVKDGLASYLNDLCRAFQLCFGIIIRHAVFSMSKRHVMNLRFTPLPYRMP